MPAEATSKPPPDAFSMHAHLEGCTAEVYLNDVPLGATHLRRLQTTVHATPWIVEGTNELRVVVTGCRSLVELPCGVVSDEDAGAVVADARVLAGFYADVVPDETRDETRVSVAWGPLAPDALAFPRDLRGSFQVRSRPRWAWQDAPILAPSAPAVRARVLAVVRELHAAMSRRDAGPFMARMKALDAEAIHFSSHAPGFAAAFGGELVRQTSDPDFAMEPLREASIVLRPIAGGRVLSIEDERGRPALRGVPEMEMGLDLPLFLAEIDGALQLARLA